MFTTTRLTTAKTQEQPTRPSREQWTKQLWRAYTEHCHSAIEKNGIMLSAETRTDLEVVILSAVGQTEKEKYHIFLTVESTNK